MELRRERAHQLNYPRGSYHELTASLNSRHFSCTMPSFMRLLTPSSSPLPYPIPEASFTLYLLPIPLTHPPAYPLKHYHLYHLPHASGSPMNLSRAAGYKKISLYPTRSLPVLTVFDETFTAVTTYTSAKTSLGAVPKANDAHCLPSQGM